MFAEVSDTLSVDGVVSGSDGDGHGGGGFVGFGVGDEEAFELVGEGDGFVLARVGFADDGLGHVVKDI